MQSNKKQKRYIKWRRLTVFLLIGFSIPVIYLLWKYSAYSSLRLNGFQPQKMAHAQYSPKDVVGDLGGMKVVIPSHFAEYVEYEGDPGFGESGEELSSERTFDSKLESFGMDVRYPDMKGLIDRETRDIKRSQPLRESNWLRVSVAAGKHYYGDRSLEGLSRVVLRPEEYPGDYWWNNYEKLPEQMHDLEIYVVSGNDPEGRPARESFHTTDIYLYRDADGKVEVHISCGRARVPNGIDKCRMSFDLEPKAKVGLEAAFRKGLLPEWRKIKSSVDDLILSFKVKGDTKKDVASSKTIPSKFNH